ncbi:hypothetical protein DPMN_047291 [Dreissena polymorpha]|uniref:Uncharacterized protein n=1 Tax=Dreissena polymorpha TaxID=45954 RepID=A0A9D4D981_DREPO|nr:hypothetical protein DPMN_047291 [Dreissena polymorpha]
MNVHNSCVYIGPQDRQYTGKTRNIVAKFSYFKDREMVRKKWKELDGTGFTVFEQYPPEVIRKKKVIGAENERGEAAGEKSVPGLRYALHRRNPGACLGTRR